MSREKTIHFISLGCPKNRVDTEVMLGVSDHASYRLVDQASDAEVIVVNTCGFIGPAKEESIDTIVEMAALKESGSCKKLVVAGCLSQRYSDDLANEMPEVDHFLGSSDMLKLGDVLSREDAPRMLVGNPAAYTLRATDPRTLSQGKHSVYVKIAEGCNRSCSFCIIPTLRGKQRSRSVDDIVREVEVLAANGALEINLISQDTIAYGRDLGAPANGKRATLADLVARVADVPGVRWVRLFYLYPEAITEPLIELLAAHPRVLPYVDMPLQHASDKMLKLMRRGHGGPRLRRVVETMRTRIPNLVFRTAFIVGHPSETDEDFDELCEFISWAELDRVGVFRYSPEEGTRSIAIGDDVPAKIAAKRARKLMSIQRPISRRKLRAMIGTEIDVLVDSPSSESDYLLEGRTKGQAPEIDGKVFLANGAAKIGTIRRARVTGAADYDLVADLIGDDGLVDSPIPAGARGRIKLRVATS